jgi:hypothetical protein
MIERDVQSLQLPLQATCFYLADHVGVEIDFVLLIPFQTVDIHGATFTSEVFPLNCITPNNPADCSSILVNFELFLDPTQHPLPLPTSWGNLVAKTKANTSSNSRPQLPSRFGHIAKPLKYPCFPAVTLLFS